MQHDWITMSTLGTFGGAVFAVTLMSQFLKGALDKFVKMPTRIMVLLISWVVLLGRQFVMNGHFTVDASFLDFLNGFMVALTSMGAHSLAKDKLNWK